MIWILVILLYTADGDPLSRVERTFETAAQCQAEQAHLLRQAVEQGGRIVIQCEARGQ